MRRILIVGPSWVGDMIMAQGLYRALRAAHPSARIDVMAPAWSGAILGRMREVNRVVVAPFAHGQLGLAERRALARELSAECYDQAFVLPNSWKSALVPWLAGIPKRTGYVGEFRYGLLNDVHRLDKVGLPRLIDRYRALAGGAPAQTEDDYPELQVDPAAQSTMLVRLGLDAGGHILALCPGAEYGSAKRWPESHYATVAAARLAQGWQVWLLGSEADRATCSAIARLAPGCRNLAGATRLGEAVDLLACADQVVTNDSGLMHIAAAIGVPLVAVYGSTDPGYTPPLSDRARVLRLGLPCSPCFERECPLEHLDCLNRLTPERVLKELDAISPVLSQAEQCSN